MYKPSDTEIVAGLIAFLGALVHATNQFKLARDSDTPFTWVDFVVLLPLSIFSSVMFGLSVSLITSDPIQLYIACGLGAFLGVAGLNALGKKILRTLTQGKED